MVANWSYGETPLEEAISNEGSRDFALGVDKHPIRAHQSHMFIYAPVSLNSVFILRGSYSNS